MTIERLNGVLSAIGTPATARELAEILWLACHLTPAADAESSAQSGGPPATVDPPAAEPERTSDEASTAPVAGSEAVPVSAGQAADTEQDKAGLFPRASAGGQGPGAQ